MVKTKKRVKRYLKTRINLALRANATDKMLANPLFYLSHFQVFVIMPLIKNHPNHEQQKYNMFQSAQRQTADGVQLRNGSAGGSGLCQCAIPSQHGSLSLRSLRQVAPGTEKPTDPESSMLSLYRQHGQPQGTLRKRSRRQETGKDNPQRAGCASHSLSLPL